MAEILGMAAPLLMEQLKHIYPNCHLEVKEYAAPNQEYNVHVSVWR
ncbi:hypothetical protein [Aeromonas diversa]|nr:hypothetical protein [Aeromonas diversa]